MSELLFYLVNPLQIAASAKPLLIDCKIETLILLSIYCKFATEQVHQNFVIRKSVTKSNPKMMLKFPTMFYNINEFCFKIS